jgi:hypothetical protein
VAEDENARAEREGLPLARYAFLTDDRAERQSSEFAISRAAALVSLLPPPRSLEADSLALDEARRLLEVVSVPPFHLETTTSAELLADVGELGTEAAQLLEEARSRLRKPGESDPVRLFAQRVDRASSYSPEQRNSSEELQREAAAALFSGTNAQSARGRGTSEPAARLALASLFDEHPLVRAAAGAAVLRFDPGNVVAAELFDEQSRRRRDEVGELAIARAGLVTARDSDTPSRGRVGAASCR